MTLAEKIKKAAYHLHELERLFAENTVENGIEVSVLDATYDRFNYIAHGSTVSVYINGLYGRCSDAIYNLAQELNSDVVRNRNYICCGYDGVEIYSMVDKENENDL